MSDQKADPIVRVRRVLVFDGPLSWVSRTLAHSWLWVGFPTPHMSEPGQKTAREVSREWDEGRLADAGLTLEQVETLVLLERSQWLHDKAIIRRIFPAQEEPR